MGKIRHQHTRQSSMDVSRTGWGKGGKYEAARAVKTPRPQKPDADATGR